jgi:hypothetical protein
MTAEEQVRLVRRCFMPVEINVGYLNLDAHAIACFRAAPTSPLLDPTFCGAWVKHLHRLNGLDVSYGGYLEDRSFMWAGSYLRPDRAVHLGVDVNAEEGWCVRCPVPFKVVEVREDPDREGGWGSRVTVELRHGGLLIFAHLRPTVNGHPEVGQEYPADTWLGSVAGWQDNGGWYPHLHLQGLAYAGQLAHHLDGYGPASPHNEELYPDPLELLARAGA